jgi:hypothetical protein
MTWGMVISLRIDESQMGNRGSKSCSITTTGKRATSRWFINVFDFLQTDVRCTLVAGKPVLGRKINPFLSNTMNIHSFLHTTAVIQDKGKNSDSILGSLIENKLDPWYITGFTDAEACFSP